MMNLKDASVLVWDRGLFLSFALRLARNGFGKVYYFNDWQRSGRPSFNELAVGTGFDGVEPVTKAWPLIDHVDCIAFPDCYDGDLQAWFRDNGYNVWGSGEGGELEIYRKYWKDVIKALGLTVAPYEHITGIAALRKYVQGTKDVYVKISRMRGLMETHHIFDYETGKPWLDKKEFELGPLSEETSFIVEKKVDTKLEIAGDTIFVGAFPEYAINGVEIKDCCYAGMVQNYTELPDHILNVNRALAPVLSRYNYSNFLAIELRIDKKDRAHPIDPCCRQASPAGEAQLATWTNFPEVVYWGSRGKLVQPEFDDGYVVESMIYSNDDERDWLAVRVPEEIRHCLNLYFGMRRGRLDWRVPQPKPFEEVGSLTVTGKSFDDAIGKLRKMAEQVEGDVIVKTDSLEDAVKEFDLMKKKGMSVVPA